MKKVLVISSTPRKGGNSERLAEQFLKGARDAGNVAEIIHLRDYNLGCCRGCYACAKTGRCIQNDGMNSIAEKLTAADVILFATPVYFYTMSAQLKIMIDRLVPCYTKIRADIYMICTAWDPNVKNLELTLESIRGCTRDCFEECAEKGALAVGDVYEVGAVEDRPEMLSAYELGRNC